MLFLTQKTIVASHNEKRDCKLSMKETITNTKSYRPTHTLEVLYNSPIRPINQSKNVNSRPHDAIYRDTK